MKYIKELAEGDHINEIYLCRKKTQATAKNGKPYESLILQDKTGSLDGKIWDPGSLGIDEYEELDYIQVTGEVIIFNGNRQLNIKRLRLAREGEYNPADFLPCSERDPDEMYQELLNLIASVKTPCMRELLESFFVRQEGFAEKFKFHSAAKSVHHGYVGGLLEHTLSVAQTCDFFASHYPFLDRSLLLTAAIFHDIGKLYELSPYPKNDYTDVGQLLGHIMIGAQIVQNRITKIPGFPPTKSAELIHCILAHHGELEFGSPKKPAIAEALALAFADNADAKLETMKEALGDLAPGNLKWQGFNRLLDSNIRKTSPEEE
ncbi:MULTISPECIES: 3'-5' exoribonuclease YhaM family protein [Shuttleworthella]|uniref:HDIG domain protein n=1 Tax=Shuttleworthella satelles DSM 14600 TaxID=626523 RepID=C4GBZ8_9FIRM|nr:MULTISPECIES: HD domain-containing protein [Shuttleworthia]EEP27940.1 HDIG domain protein [Shuttleworthia satelles DSM 14600]EUB16445.1 HDIG domain protein [Shuttleworthia sp. MSX8B]